MKTHNNSVGAPARRDLIDPRSSNTPTAAPIRKTLLNDRRSTR